MIFLMALSGLFSLVYCLGFAIGNLLNFCLKKKLRLMNEYDEFSDPGSLQRQSIISGI